MKQKDLALIIALISGVARTTISRIESRNVTPYRHTLLRLAYALDAFGCERAADLIDGDWHPYRGKIVSFC